MSLLGNMSEEIFRLHRGLRSVLLIASQEYPAGMVTNQLRDIIAVAEAALVDEEDEAGDQENDALRGPYPGA